MEKFVLVCRSKVLQLSDNTIIMGIINATPDSFSDGGEYLEPALAVEHGLEMVDQGAAIIDIGGESSRPGAQPVEPEEQIKRVIPVISQLSRQSDIIISIDTTSSKVAKAALEAGAAIINDISAMRFDKKMALLAARAKVPVILMHMQGEPGSMQEKPVYKDVVQEVRGFLQQRIEYAVSAGIQREQIIIDPGIGFGKTVEHNLLLMKYLKDFSELGTPILVGPSRKAFIKSVLSIEHPQERLWGTAAAVAWCASHGAQIVRVHEVGQMAQVVKLTAAIKNAGKI